jgi:hypothetical protein
MFLYKQKCIEDCTATVEPAKKYHHVGECVDQCPSQFYGHNGKGECLTTCPSEFYGYEVDQTCIDKSACNNLGRFIYKL